MNMRRNIYIAIIAALTLNSCSFLEVTKLGKSTIENYFSDVAALEESINGLYYLTSSAYTKYQILYPEVAGDNVVLYDEMASWDNIYRFQADEIDETSAVGYIWKSNYEIIINTNYIIFYGNELFEDYPQESERISSAIAQAHFIKALAELNLSLAYSQHYTYTPDASHWGIVLIEGLPNLTAKFVRTTAAESYADIIRNLDIAESMVRDATVNSKYFATSSAIQALKARVYLYMEDYENAEKYASMVIDSGKYQLTSKEDYGRMFMEPGYVGSEEILVFNGYGQNQNLADYFDYQAYELTLSSNLQGIFGKRTDTDRDVRYAMASHDGKFGINLKYNKVLNYDESNRYYNIHLLRLSELLLTRAEAAVHLNDNARAEDDLKTLRARALGVDKSSVSVTYGSEEDLLEQILDERNMELFTEGHRFYDLVRTRHNVEKPYLKVDDIPLSMQYPNDRFVLPIPSVELEANEIIQPNPGANTTQR